MPEARKVVQDLAVEHGACIRPLQLRRTDLTTGEVEQVLVPCGHTLASVCPSCAERAKVLRATQCREGWHLEEEPVIEPDRPTEMQRFWITKRAEAQVMHDQADSEGLDAADTEELIGELDEEIANAGMRGKVMTGGSRRHRSTRRRQDAAQLPRRKVSDRTVGKVYAAPDGKTFRPSLFITLTCPSYGKVSTDGTPIDPSAYDYQRAARDALHFAALFDRLMQTFAGSAATKCSTSRPSNHNDDSPRMFTSRSAARSPAPSCGSHRRDLPPGVVAVHGGRQVRRRPDARVGRARGDVSRPNYG
jgi:hypothetical protein